MIALSAIILAGLLLVSLIESLTTMITEQITTMKENYVYAESPTNDQNSPLIAISSNASSIGTIKTNATSSPFNPFSLNLKSQGASEVTGDFNGDGFEDQAFGIPEKNAGSINNAGSVHIIYGSSDGLSAANVLPNQIWNQNSPFIQGSPEDDDLFGSALAPGDYNGDGFDDLAIGVPGEGLDLAIVSFHDFDASINSNLFAENAGVVQIIYGSAHGLVASTQLPAQFFIQGFASIEDIGELNDLFGADLSSGDYNGDGLDDLAIGVPEENVGDVSWSGVVHVIYGSSTGLSATAGLPDQLWTQDLITPDLDLFFYGDIGEYDRFGSYLSSADYNGDGRDDLAIGAPDEDNYDVENTGVVHVIYGSSTGLSASAVIPSQLWEEADIDIIDFENDFFGADLTSGDYNGDGLDDLAIGVTGEDFDAENVGVVHVIYGSSTGLSATAVIPAQRLGTHNSTGFGSFGGVLSSGDYNGDGRDDLAIGVPSEAIDTLKYAGFVKVIYGSSDGLSATAVLPRQTWTQNSINIKDFSEQIDFFGYSLSSADYNGDGRDDLAIGVPYEDFGGTHIVGPLWDVGIVHIIYGSVDGLNANSVLANQLLWEGSMANRFDYFGAIL